MPFFLKQLGGHPDKRGRDRAVLDGFAWRFMPVPRTGRATNRAADAYVPAPLPVSIRDEVPGRGGHPGPAKEVPE
ncbi:MAG: hypothetical protein E6J41_22050 [Chloroflexi bacterium]|nr:MAG: hypothetical protein E6J41_22050 [Chloroflexota bacterium]